MRYEVSIYYLILMLFFSLCLSNENFAQEKINITAGVGMPELLNVGIRYQLKQTQIGVTLGGLILGKNENVFTIGGDFYYHFLGYSKLSNRRPWYVKAGLGFLRDETELIIHKYVYLNLRLGRDFNLSKNLGIDIEAGLGYQLFHDIIRKQPSNWRVNLELPLIPCVGICLFYRI